MLRGEEETLLRTPTRWWNGGARRSSGEGARFSTIFEGFCSEWREEENGGRGFSNGGLRWPESELKGGGLRFLDLLIWLCFVRSMGGFRRGTQWWSQFVVVGPLAAGNGERRWRLATKGKRKGVFRSKGRGRKKEACVVVVRSRPAPERLLVVVGSGAA